jgi:PRTRC genetic system protein B
LLFHTKGRELQLVTAHRVGSNGRRVPTIGPGRPITPADEREILALLLGRSSGESAFDVMPDRVLYQDASRTVWWLPGDVRPMHLRDVKGATTIRTRWPTLVLMAMDRALYIVALAANQRPASNTPVFHCPLPNVWPTTKLCSGDAALPPGATTADIPHWESVVLDTAFTHSNNRQALRQTGRKENSIEAYWKRRKGQLSPFPLARLAPLEVTLREWIAAAGRGDE